MITRRQWTDHQSGVSASSLPPAAVGVVPAVVPERAAANGVDDDDEDEEDDADDGDALPVPLQGGHHAGLARLAVVAEVRGGVAPGLTVRVRRVGGGGCPACSSDVGVAAAGGGLAAARLRRKNRRCESSLMKQKVIETTMLY
jgi:hypothetical protein